MNTTPEVKYKVPDGPWETAKHLGFELNLLIMSVRNNLAKVQLPESVTVNTGSSLKPIDQQYLAVVAKDVKKAIDDGVIIVVVNELEQEQHLRYILYKREEVELVVSVPNDIYTKERKDSESIGSNPFVLELLLDIYCTYYDYIAKGVDLTRKSSYSLPHQFIEVAVAKIQPKIE